MLFFLNLLISKIETIIKNTIRQFFFYKTRCMFLFALFCFALFVIELRISPRVVFMLDKQVPLSNIPDFDEYLTLRKKSHQLSQSGLELTMQLRQLLGFNSPASVSRIIGITGKHHQAYQGNIPLNSDVYLVCRKIVKYYF